MQFNHNLDIYNKKAAEIVVPIIIDKYNPSSVIDIGCGIGTWLSVFKDLGVKNILGVDGDWVDRSLLKKFISEENFLSFDLRNELCIDKKFDIVLSLEVAEHIDEKYADNFVKSLVNHGDIIVFSAAIPYQGGDNHVNEQWPSYWIEKFSKYDLYPDDFLRNLIWDNKEVDFWYKQNIIIFSKTFKDSKSFDVVHPDLYVYNNEKLNRILLAYTSGFLGFKTYLKRLFINIKLKLKNY